MKNMFIKSLLMLWTALLAFVANGANEKVYSTLWRTADITPGNSFSFEDARYATMSMEVSGSPSHPGRLFNAFYNKRITNRIILKIDQQNKLFQPVGYAFNVKLRITTQVYNGGSSFTSQVHEKNMLISYNPSNVYNDQSVYEFNDDNAPSQLAGYHMQVEVLQVSALPGTANIQLYAEIETERYFTFNFNTLYSANNYISPSAITSTLTSDNLNISWTPAPWAEQYDLEWFHVSNLDLGITLTPGQIAYDENSFRFDATRVTVTGNSFQIPLVYNQGYIVFRIRGYGKTGVDNYSTLIPGYWSTDNSCTSGCTNLSHLNSNCYKLIDAAHAHEEKLNWQYGLSFAEEGKHKVSVSYFDGTFRGRQTVIKSNIFNRVIVSEKIYDHEGRPAIDVLPAPSLESKISYKRSFNVNSASKAYSRLDFDLDHNTCDADEAAAMSSTKGSARYYSPNNDLADGLDAGNDYLRQFKKYIPDAEGFPFQQTIFTPDNTGDIKIKTGVGKTLMEGTGKTTRTFYGKPFQEELDRLFGTEVGNALSYNKNMVIDPNGQVSISYLNPAGKVIATNLAGNDLNGIVETVRQTPISTTPDFRVDLLNKPAFSSPIRGSENIFDFATRSLKMNRTILVDKEQPFYFSYENQGVRASFNCSIPTIKTFCYDCVFDLKISLTDECGNEYLSGINATVPTSTQTVIGQSLLTDINSATPTYNSLTRCSTSVSNIPSLAKNNNVTGPGLSWVTNNGTSAVPLKVGSYQLKKELVLNEKVLDYYTNDYIQRNTGCIKDITYFRNQFAFINEIYDCDMSCEECIDRLGAFGEYSGSTRLPNNPELTQEQYDKLMAECNARCEVKSKRCDALYETMLADISPNGQYGEVYEKKLMDGGYIYGLDANNAIKPYLYPLSVFNEGNFLPVKESFGTRRPSWRHPFTAQGETHYYTDKGEIDLIPLTPVEIGYLPAVADPSYVQIINGLPYAEPHKLLYVEDFLRLFKPSWAKSLVTYHPEYPLYLLCGEYSNSHDFDELWMSTNSYESAIGLFGGSSPYGIVAGELNPVGRDWNGGNPIGVIDPYFNPQFNANITRAEYEQMMYDMVHFIDNGSTQYSIWQVAYHLANHPNSNLLTSCHSSPTFSFDPASPAELTIGDREKFWQIFRGLYQSLKQRQQQHHFARISIANSQYDAYSGCIGNNNFNATKYGFLKFPICSVPSYLWSSLSPWFAPFWWSQYFNFAQPCNWARAYLYRNKMARFQISTDAMGYPAFDDVLAYDPDEDETFVLGQTNQEQVHKQVQTNADISMFNQCDKCPIANQLEALLNKLAEGNIKEVRELWNCSSSPDNNFNMIDQTLKEAFGTGNGTISWIPEISEETLIGNIGECTIRLIIPNAPFSESEVVRFDRLIGLYNLKYIHNPTLVAGTNNTFEITAYFNEHKPNDPSFNPANTKQVVLQGVVSCLDIANCSLKPTCVSSSTANELVNLFNTLLVVPDASKNSCTPTWPTITPSFTNPASIMLSNPPYVAALTSTLKYEFDRAISPAFVNVNEAWYWNGYVNASNQKEMTGVISASAISGNHGSCQITFEITSSTTLNMTHVKRFVFISPDLDKQPFGFVAKALASDGSTTEYITIKGVSSCFPMGKCANGPLSLQDIDSYTPTAVNCNDFEGEAELLARLNCGEFSRFTSGGDTSSGGFTDNLPRVNDGTEACLCFKASNPSTPLNLGQLALDLNTAVNNALATNPCVAAAQYCVLDSIVLTLYDDDWERVYGVPPSTTPNHIYFKVDWACFNDDTFYYDASGQIRYISRYPDFKDVYIYKRCKKEKDAYINLCQSYFQTETDVTKGLCLLKLVNNCTDCNVELGTPFNRTTIICSCPFATSGWETPGSGGGSWSGSGGSWGYGSNNCPPLPCTMQLEFPPIPGFSLENIVGFKSIKPDQDRPVPAGYFVAVVRTNTGAFMTIKGFMPCLKKAACGTCDASDITPKKYGTFPPVADDLPVITSDYADVTGGSYAPVSTMPEESYMLVTGISGDPVLHNLDNHTGDPGSRFMLLKGKHEGGTVTKIWEHSYTVEKNVLYEFTFYYANPLKNSLGAINQVLLTLNGNDATGRTVDVEVSPTWHKVTYQFKSDVATAVLAVKWIENIVGNFIAIDDISLNKVCGCQDVNLVENGNLDFKNVASSFTTDFKLNKNPILPTVNDDYIHVSSVMLPSGTVIKDQLTPGSGNFMLALVRANSGPMVFWQTTAKVQPGKEYVFDTRWLASHGDAIDLRLKVNGVVVQKINNATHIDKWLTIRGRWVNTSATVATIIVEVENINSIDCYAGLDEVKFVELCNPGVCPLPVFFKPVASNCTNIINGIIEVNAANAYNIYLEDEKRKFKEELINKCLSVYESFEMKYIQTEHLYTLYYYDQANNLVRTVPPSGVKPLTNTLGDLDQVKLDRINKQRSVFTMHDYATTYKYNSLGGILEQSMPDQDNFNVNEFYTNYNANTSNSLSRTRSSAFFAEEDGIAVGQSWSNSTQGTIHTGINATATLNPLEWGDVTSVITQGTGTALTGVYAVTKQRQLLYSTDGDNWFTRTTPSGEELIEVLAIAGSIHIYAKDGKVWSTNNNGDSWTTEASICANCEIKDVHMAKGSGAGDYLAIALATDNRLFYKNQTSANWTVSNAPSLTALQTLAVQPGSSSNTLIATGNNGNIYQSGNNGGTWSKKLTNANVIADFSAMAFATSNNGVALSGNNLYTTTDGGITWTLYSGSPTISSPRAIQKFGNEVYIVNTSGSIFKMNNAGALSTVQTLSYSNINSISVIATDEFVIGGNGGFLRYETTGSGTSFDYPSTMGISANVKAVQFSSSTNGVVLTTTGALYHITPVPSVPTFIATQKTSAKTYTGIYFTEATKGYAFTASGHIMGINLGTSPLQWAEQTKAGATNVTAYWAEHANANSAMVAVSNTGDIYTSASSLASWEVKTDKVALPPLKTVEVLYTGGTSYTTVASGEHGVILRSVNQGANWGQQTVDVKHTVEKTILGITGGTVEAYAFLNTGTGTLTLRGTSAATFTTMTTNPVPSGVVVKAAVMRTFTSSDKKAVVAGVNGSNKQIYQLDLINPMGYTHLTSTLSAVTGTYTGIAAHTLTSGSYFTYAVGPKATIPQNDHSGVLNTNLSICAYNTAGSPAVKYVSTSKFNALNDVAIAPNSTFSCAVGNGGTLLVSNNKGITWQVRNAKTTADLRAVSFYDAQNGVAVGNNVISVTRNGGETWTSFAPSSTASLRDVTILDAMFAVAVGDNQKVYMVNGADFGSSASWVDKSTDVSTGTSLSGIDLLSVSFAGKRNGVMATSTNQVVKYTINPATPLANPWSASGAISGLTAGTARQVIMPDLVKAFLVTYDGKIFKSISAGASWTALSGVPAGKQFTSITSPNNSIFYLLSEETGGSPTLGRWVRYRTEDHYGSRFYYDRLGRIVFSQNSKQYNKSTISQKYYSYTFYDAKGRTVEAGEVELPLVLEQASYLSTAIYVNGVVNYTKAEEWIKSLSAGKRTEVVRTFYDIASDPTTGPFTHLPAGFVMRNLRNRVAHITYAQVNSSALNQYDFATHYTYDAHGNVNSILHENNMLPAPFNTTDAARYKRINYEYDLISDKVNMVTYQAPLNPGDAPSPDRYFHKYEYDAENKLTHVYTSADGIIWQQDAKYLYYMHGPLARTEIGNDQVQGVDYAYTLQGWIKGVNSGSLNDARDIGKDGNLGNEGDLNRNFAYDEYGYTLGYYHGDYKDIGGMTGAQHFEIQNTVGAFYNNIRGLYNGNISSMVTAIRQFMQGGDQPQARAFVYDQLNRLRAANVYGGVNATGTNSWNGSVSMNNYQETFTYDLNGNITNLTRKDEAGNAMDNLTYRYATVANGYAKNSNRLRAVQDAISTPTNSSDIESGQAFGGGAAPTGDNYQYDELGNLTLDAAEFITNISWTLSGKIKTIAFDPASGKDNLEFYYDPNGHRTMKVAKPQGATDPAQFKYTVYTRDAEGNIMSTYKITAGDNYRQESAVIYGADRLGDFIPNYYTANNCGLTLPVNFDYKNIEKVKEHMIQVILQSMGTTDTKLAESIVNSFLAEFETRNGLSIDRLERSSVEAIMAMWARIYCNIHCYFINEESARYLSDQHANFVIRILEVVSQKTGNYSQPIIPGTQLPDDVWKELQKSAEREYIERIHEVFPAMGFANDCGLQYAKGSRRYELSNHLGNVLAVVSDRKKAVQSGTTDMPLSDSRFTHTTDGWNKLAATTASASLNMGTLRVAVPASGDGVSKQLPVELGTHNFDFFFTLTKVNTANIRVVIEDGAGSTMASGSYGSGGVYSLTFSGSGYSGNWVNIKVYQNGAPVNANAYFTLDNALLTRQGVVFTEHYEADLLQATDYYAFGSLQPNRSWEREQDFGYKYGFNGMERDDEVKGDANSYTTQFRQYDPRLGRWLSVDPEEKEYPDESPYSAMENTPTMETDPNGDCPWCVAFIKGAVQEYATQVVTNLATGKSIKDALTDVDGWEIAKAGAIDAVTLGVGSMINKASTAVKVAKAADKAADTQKAASKVNKVANTTEKVSKIEKNVVKVEKKVSGCFIKGTKVLTKSGYKFIELIEVGDTVLAYSDSLHKTDYQRVYKTYVRSTDQLITFMVGNIEIVTTPEHPFYINNSWIKAKYVQAGDSVFLDSNKKHVISNKYIRDTICSVYNFAVEHYHTYFVSELAVLVHNNCGGDLPTSRQARREAMRKANIPTSQPLHQDKLTKGSDRVLLTRDKKSVVMDAKNDVSHKGQPHWEAGKAKQNPNAPDGLNRSGKNNKPQMQNQNKQKVYYDPNKKR